MSERPSHPACRQCASAARRWRSEKCTIQQRHARFRDKTCEPPWRKELLYALRFQLLVERDARKSGDEVVAGTGSVVGVVHHGAHAQVTAGPAVALEDVPRAVIAHPDRVGGAHDGEEAIGVGARAEQVKRERLSEVTGGMDLPGLF